MNEKKYKIIRSIIGSFFIFFILFNFCANTTFAAINKNYEAKAEVFENNLDEKIKQSTIIDILGSFIYAVASIAEQLVGWIFGLLTGDASFPWADKVIFNSIAFLDINFINPAPQSLFNSSTNGNSIIYTSIGKIIQNIYYTVFTIAVCFLGVCVGIMAIRLIFASIAAEKAKYKQALMQWIIAIILLFSSQYMISFIFFVNEKMVETASIILTNVTKKYEDKLGEISARAVSYEEQEERIKKILAISLSDEELDERMKYLEELCNGPDYIYDVKTQSNKFVNKSEMKLAWMLLYDIKSDKKLVVECAYALTADNYYANNEISKLDYDSISGWSRFWDKFWGADQKELKKFISDVVYLFEQTKKLSNGVGYSESDVISEIKNEENDYWKSRLQGYSDDEKKQVINSVTSAWIKVNCGYDSVKNNDIFASMGQFFKDSAWTYKTDENGKKVGWTQSKNNVIGSILYAMFIAQSITFFVAYTKRFFYVIILALFSPIVVVYDFAMKSIS